MTVRQKGPANEEHTWDFALWDDTSDGSQPTIERVEEPLVEVGGMRVMTTRYFLPRFLEVSRHMHNDQDSYCYGVRVTGWPVKTSGKPARRPFLVYRYWHAENAEDFASWPEWLTSIVRTIPEVGRILP